MSTPPPAPPQSSPTSVDCPGCGGRNPPGATDCEWCGRSLVPASQRLRFTFWQVVSATLLGLLLVALALLAWRNLGRNVSLGTEPAPGAVAATAVVRLSPTPVVTPRITTPTTPTPRVTATSAPALSTPPPATPTPQPRPGVIAHTGGAGVVVRADPGPQAAAIGSLREGAPVILTGNQQTVAARSWSEVQSTEQNLKGWVSSDFVDQRPTQP